jgi:uncharacterized protein (DUF1499 family)
LGDHDPEVAASMFDPILAFARVPLLAALTLLGCGGTRPSNLGPQDGGLAPCPDTPNCVHTGESGASGAEPFLLARTLAEVWPQLGDAIESMPRTRVVSETERYLHAEATSLIFRFVDDLEVYAPEEGDRLVVRSASRVGKGDLGVNRRRVERLRAILVSRGLIRQP